MSIKPTKSHISGIDMVCAVCKENIEPYQHHFYVRPEHGIPVVLHAKDCYHTYMQSMKKVINIDQRRSCAV